MASSTLKIYNTLNPDQKIFANEKRIDTSMKLKRWLDFLQPLAQMDRVNDESRRKKKIGIGFIIFGLVVSFFVTTAFLPAVIALILLVVLLIIQISKLNKLKKMDIGNHLRLFLMPFIVVLKEEADANSLLKITFDASEPLAKEKITNEVSSKGMSLPRIKSTFYTNPWLNLRAVLADGSVVLLEFEDVVRKSRITKRGSSGKIKTKTKIKIKHRLVAKVLFKKEHYDFVHAASGIEYADVADYHQFKLKQKRISYSLQKSIELNDALGMIAAAYTSVKAK